MKVNGQCYWDILLSQQMLAVIKHIAADDFVFQQDSSPAQRETINFLSPEL